MLQKTPASPSASDLAIPHAEGVSNDEFRTAMARLAAGVVLVTMHDHGGPLTYCQGKYRRLG